MERDSSISLHSQDFNPDETSTTLQMGHRISSVSKHGFNPKSSSTVVKGAKYVASQYCLNAKGSMEVRLEDKENWEEKLSFLNSNKDGSVLITPYLPDIDSLMEAYDAEYKQRLLNNMLDYGRIASSPYPRSDGSMNRPRQSDVGCKRDEAIVNIETYLKGLDQLKHGLEKGGKREVKKAADKGLAHARYVYAITIFREIVQYHMYGKSKPAQKEIEEAVKCMLATEREFFPLPTFILGIMQSRNQLPVSKKFATQVLTSPRKYLNAVLRGIEYREHHYSLVVPKKYVVIEDENGEYLKWIVQSAKYELAKGLLLYPEGLSGAKSLLQELSSGGFADAKCLYALTLLKDAFGDALNFERENFDQAYSS